MDASDLRANRRRFLTCSAASAISAPGLVFAETLRRTPGEVLGPYYPVAAAFPKTHDLTRNPGARQRAKGELLRVSGRVLNTQGRPVPRARIEIWQANAAGRYDHPSDNSGLPLDPDFRGLAVFETDDDGRYAFLTIKPGSYPSERGMRTPHIHYEVTGRVDRLVTQAYFPGEALNATDPFLKTEVRPEALMLTLAAAARDGETPRAASFDLIVATG